MSSGHRNLTSHLLSKFHKRNDKRIDCARIGLTSGLRYKHGVYNRLQAFCCMLSINLCCDKFHLRLQPTSMCIVSSLMSHVRQQK